MISRLSVTLRRFRRLFTRSYWELRLFPLSRSENTSSTAGLLLIQIDGLSQKQLRRAIRENNLPFIKRLLRRENYVEYAHYSGLPSATPGIQGELFYGVKGCVPAFNFLDRETEKVFTMYDPRYAGEIEKRLSRENRGLLEGGSSYSNIFSGGAQESHFCAATIGWQGFFKGLNPLTWIFLFVFHLDIIIRTAFLLVIELVLAFIDSIRGILKGEYVFMELQFIISRVFVCVLLRELVVLGAKIDIARGLPIIHLNFFGYDEQAHRRGPSSAFAHWCLQGIDSAIGRIWQEARLAERREYDLWIYSDHGQEDTVPYKMKFKKGIENVITEIFGKVRLHPDTPKRKGFYGCTCGGYQGKTPPKAGFVESAKMEVETCEVSIMGLGPLCHIYPHKKLSMDKKKEIARQILQKAQAHLILVPDEGERVWAITQEETYTLPEHAIDIFGAEHPFLEEVTKDLIALAHHPNAGELIVSGWLVDKKPMTFPVENGSHAGFGTEETNGFALLPQDAPLPERSHEYLRPLHLRKAAMRLLDRDEEDVISYEAPRPVPVTKVFRVACYNVHGCLGMDGKRSPERIARVIARHTPDAIALQELDAGCERSGNVHQAEVIAKKLQMVFHFHPSFCLNGHYGNGVLSRHPMRLVKVGPLPQMRNHKTFEPRGVLWVELDIQGVKIQLLTTHLSLWPQERALQAEALLGPEWLGHPDCRHPVILAGDFNSGPDSKVYKKLASRFLDAQLLLESHRPHGTWLKPYSFTRIDHVFVTPDVKVKRILVPNTELDKTASDHFPLFIDLEIVSTFGDSESSSGAENAGGLKRKKEGPLGGSFQNEFMNHE